MDADWVASTLARHTLVDTRSPEEARQEIGRIFCPHFLSPSDRRAEGFHAVHRSARQSGYSLNYVSYGAEVEIDPGELGNFFLLQIPVAGSAAVRCGTDRAEASTGRTATVLSPTLPTRMLWSDGCSKLIVLIDRAMMQRHCEALAGRAVGAVEFATGIDITTASGRLLSSHVRLMLEAIDAENGPPAGYLVRMGEGLASLMLASLRHSQDAALAAPAAPADSRTVERAEAWIRANAGNCFSVAEVADAAGTSLRSLQNGIRRQRGVTLTQAIQDIRLERFRQALTDPRARGGVTDLAYAAGLGHAGRAASAYRRRYGETPAETLRRKR